MAQLPTQKLPKFCLPQNMDQATGFLRLLDHMPIPIMVHQMIGTDENDLPLSKAVFHNTRFIEEIGYEIKDTPNNQVWMNTAYPDLDYRKGVVDRWKVARAETSKRGDSFAETISCVRCRDGRSRWYKIAHDFHSHLRSGYMIFAFIDITVLKHQVMENEKLASTDPLTGLLNRRSMMQRFEKAREDALQSDQPYGCVVGDLDYFNSINDTFGHDCGDRALQLVAKAATDSIRPGDAVARWGGEEFCFVFPRPGTVDMQAAIEALRVRLADLNFSWEGKEFPISMTFGMTWSDGTEPVEIAIKRADTALLKGKAEGRDRVVISSERDQSLPYTPHKKPPLSVEKRRLHAQAVRAYKA